MFQHLIPTSVVPDWKPSFFVRASFAVHGLALFAVIAVPKLWGWAILAMLVNHLALTIFGLWPTCRYLGPNLTRLPEAARRRNEVALTFDDGPDPDVTPLVLDILDRYQAKATFFVVGARAMRLPDLCREIVRRGHTLANHTQHHKNSFACLGWKGQMQQIVMAQQTIKRITGQEPRLFRAPMGMRNPILDPVLSRLGLPLITWNRRGYDTRCADCKTLLARLTRKLGAGDIVLLHDGNSAISVNGQPVILELLPKLLNIITAMRLKPVALEDALCEPQANDSLNLSGW